MNANVTQTIRAQVRGHLVQPGDPDYDSARAVHNGMIDRRPALVVQCADENDVQIAVAIARDHGMPLGMVRIL